MLHKVYSSQCGSKKCDLNFTDSNLFLVYRYIKAKTRSKPTEIDSTSIISTCYSDFIYKTSGLQDLYLLPCFLWDPVDHQHQQCPAQINCERLEASNQHQTHKIINVKINHLQVVQEVQEGL